MDARIDVMLADHSAKGMLRSGNTIIAAVRIFEEESQAALDQVLMEAAKLIEHRGSQWTSAMDGIGEALEHQIVSAPSRIARAKLVAAPRNSGSLEAALDARLREVGGRLRERLRDFGDGWTSPVPKPFKDRHPLQYALLLLVAGALIGAVATALKAHL